MTVIVLTTINIPTVLSTYIDICNKYGHKNVQFVVIGDRKSPRETDTFIHSLQGYDIFYLDIEKQEDWLKKMPAFRDFLPYNSVERRNIGYLYAAELGADVIITIDDDNIPLMEYDYIGDHGIVGNTIECDSVTSSTGWFNTCSLFETEPPRRFYHRGFPYSRKWLNEELTYTKEKKRVVVNAGLWLGDPDVDTITRMEEPFITKSVKNPTARLLLAKGTMSPFNSQNTAFSADILPCFYLITFRTDTHSNIIAKNNSFRYDDIWMSYFAKVIIDHMGDAVCIGPPHVKQERNAHNFMLDLHRELGPMEITDKLVDMLTDIKLSENTYLGAFRELTEKISSSIVPDTRFTSEQQSFLSDMTEGMWLWADAVSYVTTK